MGWSATPQGRRELAAAGLFVVAFATIPIVRMELYPFSRAPMFADAPRHYCEYTLTDGDGRALELADFGLQRNYWGNPLGVGVGFQPVPSLDSFGDVPSREAVTAHVEERLAAHPELSHVEVTQTVVGAVADQHIGTVQSAHWPVQRPERRGAAR
jgi:hypothetical protein